MKLRPLRFFLSVCFVFGLVSLTLPSNLLAQDADEPELIKPGDLKKPAGPRDPFGGEVIEGAIRGELIEKLEKLVPGEIAVGVARPDIAVAPARAVPKPGGIGVPPLGAVVESEEMRMVVRLRDGTVIMGKPLTVEFPIETPYGTLMIPLASLRSATFGLRIPEDQKKAAEEAIKQLGGTDFKARDRAQGVLRNMGQGGLSAIKAALDAGVDLETAGRLEAVIKEVAPQGIDSVLLDSLSAGGVKAVGQITIPALEVDCSLGKLSITLEKLREIRSLGGTAFSENFENYATESSGWKTEAANNTIWHVVGRKSKDGKNAMWCGVKGGNQYSDNAQAVLTSPPIDISKLDSPVLQFSYWLQMEDGADSFMMEFSKDGGSNWEGTNQYSSNGSWSQQRVDLSDFRSHNFRFRFRFMSDGSSVEQGAYVDGFTIGEIDELE